MRRWVLAGLLLTSCDGSRSREREIHDTLARVALDSHSGTGDDIHLAICGVRFGAGAKLKVDELGLKLFGDDEKGRGEMTAVITDDAGVRCEGMASFTYAQSHNRDFGRFTVGNFERKGEPVPLVAEVKKRAAEAVLGTPLTATLTDDWPLLPGKSASAFRFQIPRDGRYGFRLPRPRDPDEVWFVAYQDDHPINDPQGGITEIGLVAGPVWVLVLSGKAGPAVLDAAAVSATE